MSSIGARLFTRPRERAEGYAFCPTDGFWFRPAYTEGKCPLCGELAPGGAAPPPLWADRSWFGVGLLAFESLVMLAVVLFMYFSR